MIDFVKKYMENRIQLVKLELVTVSANIGSNLVSSFLILIFSMFILLMFSFSLAFWLGELLNSVAIGFLIVGGIYTIIFLFYLLYSKQVIESKVKDKIVSSALSQEKEIDQEEVK